MLVVRAPLGYIIRKIIIVQTYGDHPLYATPDVELIARMLHLPADKNTTYNKQSMHSVTQHKPEYKIDNRTVYDILDHICKDTDLYSYVKQHKSKRDGREAFYDIHSRWLGLYHVNAIASALQTSTYDGEMKACNWDVSSTISSLETLWNIGTKDLIQGKKSDTC